MSLSRLVAIIGGEMSFDDVPMEFDVEDVDLIVSLRIRGTNGSELNVNFEHRDAESIDSVYDSFRGAMNTLVGFVDSRS